MSKDWWVAIGIAILMVLYAVAAGVLVLLGLPFLAAIWGVMVVVLGWNLGQWLGWAKE